MKKSKRKWIIIGGVVLFIIIIASVDTPEQNANQGTPQSPQEQSQNKKTDAIGSSARVGEEAILNNNDDVQNTEGVTLAAVDRESYDQLTKTSVAGDKTGFNNLILAGKVFGVPNGTKVLVIDRAFGIRQVRFLEGEYEEQSGWVAYEFLKK